MNPTSEGKLARLVELLRLEKGARVIDIGCGKGTLLIRLAEAYDVRGTGVDISRYCIADATKNANARGRSAQLEFIQTDGADVKIESHSMALASCLGASWIWGGYKPTLVALAGMVCKDGWVVVGEPYWRTEPSENYLKTEELRRDEFGTHAENAAAGEALGLTLMQAIVSSQDEFDVYDGLQWYAAEEYARTHADDPDVPVLLARTRKSQRSYLREGRETLGWAIYMFRT
jgi:SAM-dependent methyltransferase